MTKKVKGQFYTTNNNYILDGITLHLSNVKRIIEPFAGKGDLLKWLNDKCYTSGIRHNLPIQAYDIDPKADPESDFGADNIIVRDTLIDPPNYNDAFVITNPPYLAKNKCSKSEEITRSIYDKYNTNDLYKCFLLSLTNSELCTAGIIIIPAGFFFSPRDIDSRCRNSFLSKYKLLTVKYFEETVFQDTTTTVVAISFEKSQHVLTEQNVEWISMPSGERRVFKMSSDLDWIIGGEVYKLHVPKGIKIIRYVDGSILKEGFSTTFMTLSALDSGTKEGKISLTYKKNYIYKAKECSRTYATLCIYGLVLSEEEQQKICLEFNSFIEKKREETWSLFLPQFRESKEYARKRIPFELAYIIVSHIIGTYVIKN